MVVIVILLWIFKVLFNKSCLSIHLCIRLKHDPHLVLAAVVSHHPHAQQQQKKKKVSRLKTSAQKATQHHGDHVPAPAHANPHSQAFVHALKVIKYRMANLWHQKFLHACQMQCHARCQQQSDSAIVRVASAR